MMTDEKCRFILDLYALALNEMRTHHPDSAAHVETMLPKMRQMLDDISGIDWHVSNFDGPASQLRDIRAKREKFMRWLGFVQGVFYMAGVYTIEQMKQHNRPNEVAP